MSTASELTKIYEMLMTAPGMNEPVKIELRLPRKSVLLLSKIIERGISPKDAEAISGILSASGEQALQEVKTIPDELLKKAGLTEMNEKLKSL